MKRQKRLFTDTYEKLPDTGKYLERIGCTEKITLDLKGLDSLIYAHQLSVPYENTDIYEYGLPIRLEADALSRKIIEERRGGYCFELNGLFFSLLYTLGFDAYPCSCRVMKNSGSLAPIRHRGTSVRLDKQLYYCDVGYGGRMYPGAVLIREKNRQERMGEEFWMEQYDESWWMLKRKETREGNEEGFCELMVGTFQNSPLDYCALNEFCWNSPDSPFRRHLRAHIRTETGYCGLIDRKLTTIREGREEIRILDSELEIAKALELHFHLPVRRDTKRNSFSI